MIFRVYKNPKTNKYELKPLLHIPPDKEEQFIKIQEQNTKNNSNAIIPYYIRLTVKTPFIDCLRYNPNEIDPNKRIYVDQECIHKHRVERKINDFKSVTELTILEFLHKHKIIPNSINTISRALVYIEYIVFNNNSNNNAQSTTSINTLKNIHSAIKDILFQEYLIEQQIYRTKTYQELQQFDSYKFKQEYIIPKLEQSIKSSS